MKARQPADTLSRMRDRLVRESPVPDGRLPPERALAGELGISRAELRKALAVLEAEGRLRRHVGRGTFVAEVPLPSPDALDDVAEITSPREAVQARLVLEPELLRLAAINATPRQIARCRALAAEMRQAGSWERYEALDGNFHRLLAEAAGNALLAAVHGIVDRVRREVIWTSLVRPPPGPPPDYHSFAEHDAIVEAVARRDREGAAEAMRHHLLATASLLIGEGV